MTLLYYDPIFLQHDTGRHPECAQRLTTVVNHLQSTTLLQQCATIPWQAATIDRLTAVHTAQHVDNIQRLAESGGGQVDADTVVSPSSYQAAAMAAGAVCDATDRVIQGEHSQALLLVRPPGHHALANQAMGFCLFNSIAIASQWAIAGHELDRVLIVDWDVHHGNGTQAIFWNDPRVGFFSAHRWPFYPGTGTSDETGAGRGLGTTLNLPVSYGTSRKDYLSHFSFELEKFADQIQPQLVMVSAGFDSHRTDPVGSLGLESEDFRNLTRVVQEIAQTHANGKIVSVLEGGYNPESLAECVTIHLEQLMTTVA